MFSPNVAAAAAHGAGEAGGAVEETIEQLGASADAPQPHLQDRFNDKSAQDASADASDPQSVSYIGAMPKNERADVVKSVFEIVAEFDEPFDYPYRTDLNVVYLR